MLMHPKKFHALFMHYLRVGFIEGTVDTQLSISHKPIINEPVMLFKSHIAIRQIDKKIQFVSL